MRGWRWYDLIAHIHSLIGLQQRNLITILREFSFYSFSFPFFSFLFFSLFFLFLFFLLFIVFLLLFAFLSSFPSSLPYHQGLNFPCTSNVFAASKSFDLASTLSSPPRLHPPSYCKLRLTAATTVSIFGSSGSLLPVYHDIPLPKQAHNKSPQHFDR